MFKPSGDLKGMCNRERAVSTAWCTPIKGEKELGADRSIGFLGA
jgi:hypothetical protein